MKRFFQLSFSDKRRQAGFTLVEMAVVAAIIGFMSGAFIISFARNRIDIDQSTNLVISVIREAQVKSTASALYQGQSPCGYGIHYISPTSFGIYVGPTASTTTCSATNKNFQDGEDTLLRTQTFIDGRIEFKAPFNDIYFSPPDPKTYLNNNSSLDQTPISISVGVVGTNCPTNCKTVYVYPSGTIESQ